MKTYKCVDCGIVKLLTQGEAKVLRGYLKRKNVIRCQLCWDTKKELREWRKSKRTGIPLGISKAEKKKILREKQKVVEEKNRKIEALIQKEFATVKTKSQLRKIRLTRMMKERARKKEEKKIKESARPG